MFRRMGPSFVAALVLTAACGGAASPAPQASPSAKPVATAALAPAAVTVLASGRIDSIPDGTLYVDYMDLPQVAGGSLTHQHIGGFVYAVQGTHEMDVAGIATPTMIEPGKAAFIGGTVMHSHVNPSPTGNDWWFIGLRASSTRSRPAVLPGQKIMYASGDVTQITPGAYTETFTDSRLTANGTDHQTGPSLRVLYVLDGTVTVTGDAATAGTISVGQGTYSLPGATVVLTAGAAGAHYLMFTLTPAN